MKAICKIEGCTRPHYGHGYCTLHWNRWYRHGDPLKVRVPATQVFLRSDNLKRPAINDGLQGNICSIFKWLRMEP